MATYKNPLDLSQSLTPKKMTYLDARDKVYELRKQRKLMDEIFAIIDDWYYNDEFEDIDEDKINDLKDIAMQPYED